MNGCCAADGSIIAHICFVVHIQQHDLVRQATLREGIGKEGVRDRLELTRLFGQLSTVERGTCCLDGLDQCLEHVPALAP